jgi:hypothetical protein
MNFKESINLCFGPDEMTIRGYPLTHLLAVEISKPHGLPEVMTLFFSTDCIEVTGKNLEQLRDRFIKGNIPDPMVVVDPLASEITYTVETVTRHSYKS